MNTLFKKPVNKIDINTLKVIEEYNSLTEAAFKNNTNITNISCCCRGKANTHLGYFWKFKDDLNKEFLINEKNSKILEYDSKTGKLLNKYNSIGEASKLTGINYSQISMMCNDTSKESNNKYFRYENNDFPKQERIKTFKKVVLIENNIPTIFNSLKDCSEYLKCSAKCVIKNCKSMKYRNKDNVFF